ncbi:MAG: hypothetical protein RBU37_22200 [Myxococcota bacterium]|nr:hypothetical protein [Myxococcota bacterium]
MLFSDGSAILRSAWPLAKAACHQLGGTGQAPNRQEVGGTGQAPNRQEVVERSRA